MIFALGGFVILIVSFAFALFSLIREQKVQGDLEKHAQDQRIDAAGVGVGPDFSNQVQPAGNVAVDNDDVRLGLTIAEPEKSEEEIRSAKREEAYKILESRVNKMVESEVTRDTADEPTANQRQQIRELQEDSDTNIQDKAEADLIASVKVPFPWEERTDESVSSRQNEKPVQAVDQSTLVPVQTSDWMSDEPSKLNGQINIRDIGKDED